MFKHKKGAVSVKTKQPLNPTSN